MLLASGGPGAHPLYRVSQEEAIWRHSRRLLGALTHDIDDAAIAHVMAIATVVVDANGSAEGKDYQ